MYETEITFIVGMLIVAVSILLFEGIRKRDLVKKYKVSLLLPIPFLIVAYYQYGILMAISTKIEWFAYLTVAHLILTPIILLGICIKNTIENKGLRLFTASRYLLSLTFLSTLSVVGFILLAMVHGN